MVGCWLLLIVVFSVAMAIYSHRGGLQASAPDHWPPNSKVNRSNNLPNFLLFIHPLCPCSKASVGELEKLMPYLENKAKVSVIFFHSEDLNSKFSSGSLFRKVASIPHVEIFQDSDGAELKRFSVETSGQALFYNLHGLLAFRGGITPERGHMGDNEGSLAIRKLVSGSHVNTWMTSVFGCPIKSPLSATPASWRKVK